MEQTQTQSGGIGFVGVLTIAFVVLKLTGQIAWSWWWVLSPIWIAVSFVCAIFAVLILFAVICYLIDSRQRKRRRAQMGKRLR